MGQQGCYLQKEEVEASTRTLGNSSLLATYFSIWPHKPNACYHIGPEVWFITDHNVAGAILRQQLLMELCSLIFEVYGPSSLQVPKPNEVQTDYALPYVFMTQTKCNL